MIGIILSFIGGAAFGVVTMCVFITAGQADKHLEYDDNADISKK